MLLVLAMALTMTTVAFAADTVSPRLTMSVERGNGVTTATVYLENGEGLTNGRITVSYNPEAATLEGAQALLTCGAASVNREGTGKVSLAWVGSKLTGEKAALLRLNFSFKGTQDLILTAVASEAYAGKTVLTVETGTVIAACNPFTDIDNHWAKTHILKAYHAGIFVGTTETTFAPQANMSRAMFVTVLYRMAGRPAVKGGTYFTDVEQDQYYADAVAWAAETGITVGVGKGLFAPYKLLNREETAAMLYRFAQVSGRDVSKTAELSRFTDESQVSGWAKETVSWAVAEGLLQGYPNGTLSPRGNATRAEVASILVRYAGIREEEP